jgi:hypothetical protein
MGLQIDNVPVGFGEMLPFLRVMSSTSPGHT